MKADCRRTIGFLATLSILMILAPGPSPRVLAQEDVEPEESEPSKGFLLFEIETWIAQPFGTEYTPATLLNPADPFGTELLQIDQSTDSRGRYRVGYAFPKNLGALILTWYSHSQDKSLDGFNAGEFVFGETLTNPFHAGINDDGLADAFEATAQTQLRDLRIDFYRTAFSTPRAVGRWFVGWRRVFHQRVQEATYFSLVPGLPPLLPPLTQPRADLDPLPDLATMQSKFEGRGPEGGMDFLLPVWKDRVSMEAGFAVGVLRGKIDTTYQSATRFYAIIDTLGNIVEVLAPPFDEFEELEDPMDPTSDPLVDSIRQFSVPIGLQSNGLSRNGSLVEAYLGFRGRVWRQLELYGGFRAVRYDNAGTDLRAKNVTISANGEINVQDVTQTDRSAGYEGFYFGLAYRTGGR